MFAGRTEGFVTGAICGTMLDLFTGTSVGITGTLLAIIGYLGGYFDNNFSKDSKITIILMVIGVTFAYELIKYLLNVLFFSFGLELIAFFKILFLELLYQFFITIILYPLMRNIGYEIENIFKGNNILTKYF